MSNITTERMPHGVNLASIQLRSNEKRGGKPLDIPHATIKILRFACKMPLLLVELEEAFQKDDFAFPLRLRPDTIRGPRSLYMVVHRVRHWVGLTVIWMFHLLVQLPSGFRQIPISPGRTGQTVEHSEFKSGDTLYFSLCSFLVIDFGSFSFSKPKIN